MAATDNLGKKAQDADRAFREGKRERKPPVKLKALKTVAIKTQADYAKARKTIVANGVYIIQDATGFVVMRNNTGSKRHGTHPKLEEAQAAAEGLLS